MDKTTDQNKDLYQELVNQILDNPNLLNNELIFSLYKSIKKKIIAHDHPKNDLPISK